MGSLKKLIDSKSVLSFTKDSQYVFKVKNVGQNLVVNEVPGCSLEKMFSFQYLSNDKQEAKTVKDVKKLLSGLSPKELENLLRRTCGES